MSRLWKHPKLNLQELETLEWDLIELPITVDVDAWKDWYNTVKENFDQYSYGPKDHKELVGNTHTREIVFEYANKSVWGNPKQWMLQWGVQREGVIPPVTVADPDFFTEMKDDFNPSRVNLSHYMFGAYKQLHDVFGEDSFQITKLLEFMPEDGLKPHVDVVNGFMFRLNIQIQNNDNVKWLFSDDHSALLHVIDEHDHILSQCREYTLEEGKVYLVNTAVTHAVKNLGDNTLVMLQTDPKDSALTRLLSTEELHIC